MGAALLRTDGQLRGTKKKKKTKRNHNRVRSMKSSLETLVLLGGSQAGVDGLKDEGENDGIHQKSLKKNSKFPSKKPHLSTLLCPKSSSLSKERL